jgi:uncharacterized protein YecE (DUF72 family)
MILAPGRLCVGTSGWVYRQWRGSFYPESLRQKDWFGYYAERFDTAEINATFYRLPSPAAVAVWREAAPPGFQFAWKASRYITQAKKLRDVEAPLARVYGPMAELGDKAGPTLFQLPPQLRLDLERLERFLELLPDGRQAIEFRHPSWFSDAVFAALARHDVALCVSDHHDAPSPWMATASFAYVRGHGPGGRYEGSYGDSELSLWADHISAWRREGRDTYAYFDNDIGCAAPGDALRLRDGHLGA